eukprot:SAG31_NODE_8760_length_1393_cov_1.088872_1_plen_240_part_00
MACRGSPEPQLELLHPAPVQQICGCTGWRVCTLCEHTTRRHIADALQQREQEFEATGRYSCQVVRQKYEAGGAECLGFTGATVHRAFITPSEETKLVAEIDARNWKLSQSGRRKQDYGPRANFKKKKLRIAGFTGLPAFSAMIVHRLRHIDGLAGFQPVELGCLEYCASRGASIEPHIDDTWLWGDVFVILSLLCDATMTFGRTERKSESETVRHEVTIELPRRSLLVVTKEARYFTLG